MPSHLKVIYAEFDGEATYDLYYWDRSWWSYIATYNHQPDINRLKELIHPFLSTFQVRKELENVRL